MRALLFFLGVEYKVENFPSDMVKVLCVDANGVLQTATMARVLYQKWVEEELLERQYRGTYTAFVDITITEKGISHGIRVGITADQHMDLEKIVDFAVNHTKSIPKDSKIPKEMRQTPSKIIKNAIQQVEMQKEVIINREKDILATTTPDDIRYAERMGIPTQSGFMSGVTRCSYCNHQINSWQRFCTNCGSRQV